MRKQRKPARSADGSFAVQAVCCIRSAILACIITAVLILVLALLLKWSIVPLTSIRLVNTLIKAVCACFAGLLCARRLEKRASLFAGLAGLLYIVLAYLVFSLLDRSFAFDWRIASDLALGFACGMGTAIICHLVSDLRAQSQ